MQHEPPTTSTRLLTAATPTSIASPTPSTNSARSTASPAPTDDEARALPTIIDRRTLLSSSTTTWRTDAGDLDIMTEVSIGPGRERNYSDLYDASSGATLRGGPVRIAALDDIIASKRHANRGKDQAALPELERLARQLALDDGIDLT